MFDGDTNFRYDGRPIADLISEQAPTPPRFSPHNDFTVYVMGPYTAFDSLEREARDTDLPVFIPGDTYSTDAADE